MRNNRLHDIALDKIELAAAVLKVLEETSKHFLREVSTHLSQLSLGPISPEERTEEELRERQSCINSALPPT